MSLVGYADTAFLAIGQDRRAVDARKGFIGITTHYCCGPGGTADRAALP
jgi:hypothetical protein